MDNFYGPLSVRFDRGINFKFKKKKKKNTITCFLDTDTIIKQIVAGYLMNSVLVAFYQYAHLRFVVFLGSSRNAPPNMCPAFTFCYHFYRHAKKKKKMETLPMR